MAGNTKDAWDEVGDRFAEWSRMLAERYKLRGEQLGANSLEDRRKLEEAVQGVTRQLDQAFTALGETLRDPEAKKSLGNAARAFGDAMSTTLSEAGDQIRSRFGSSGPSDKTD